MRHATLEQLPLFPAEPQAPGNDTTSTFADNLSLPIHRWFRYSAGFSAAWVRQLIKQEKLKGRARILDPFAGCGTVLLECEASDVEGRGVEAHPFVARVCRAKLNWRECPKAFRQYALSVLDEARKHQSDPAASYPKLIEKCFPPLALSRLDSLRRAWASRVDGSAFSELTWLALGSILRQCSPVGTAPWQYVLPNKAKAKTLDPYQAFETKIHVMVSDMARRQRQPHGPAAQLWWEDARQCPSLSDGWADLVITSPPYVNNYDYADATRLEMAFWGEVTGWGDLQHTVRKYLIRSCTQHVAAIVQETERLLRDPVLDPITEEIYRVCGHLEAERGKHGGKKPYHTMIAAYFSDMAKMWLALRRVCAAHALVCFVVGDSAPYGVHVPVERWLGELAVAAGFNSYAFEKTRDRNVKWKNRKHRVPLHEGRLWITG